MTKPLTHLLPLICIAIYVLAASIGAFTGGLWGGLGIAGALILWFGFWITDRKPALTPRDLTFFTLAALGLLAAELPFSSDITLSAKVWLQLATIFIPLLLFSSKRLQQGCASPAWIPATALAMALGAVFLWLELDASGPLLHFLKKPATSLTEYNRGMAHLALLAFPVIAGLMLSRGRIMAAALGLLLLLPAGLTESHTAKLALILGALVICAAMLCPLWIKHLMKIAVIAATGWPLYARFAFAHFYDRVEAMHHSFTHRVEIWDYLSYRIAERPFFGWGLGATHLLTIATPDSPLYQKVLTPAPHAHNFIMTLWVETGLAGIVFGVAFLFLILRKIASLDRTLQPYAYGGFAASLTIASFGFDFWTDSLWAAFALSAFMFAALQQNLQSSQNRLDI